MNLLNSLTLTPLIERRWAYTGQAEVTPLEMSRMVSTIIREGRLASGAPVTLLETFAESF